MKFFARFASVAAAAAALLVTSAPGVAQDDVEIGGLKVVTLSRKAVSTTRPEFTSVTLAPGRGMELLKVTANFPGKGEVQVLSGPDMSGIKQMLDTQDTPNGDLGYRLGAAFLVPYPNRIRGKLSADGQTLTTEWNGKALTLPANNAGKLPTAEKHAMHGLILKAKADNVKVVHIPGGEMLTAVVRAGNFGGHWFSKTNLNFTITLTGTYLDATVIAQNVGKESEPISIGWHPYFNFPSGDRSQVKIEIPGTKYATVDNYDNVFPTGKLLPVDGTQYDLRAAGGVALGKNFYDDNWSSLNWKNGTAAVKISDPEAKYGVSIEGISPLIKTIQMYAPPTQQFAAIEHQFNFADPFGKEWNGMDTGMVTLKPGQKTQWKVRLRVFVP